MVCASFAMYAICTVRIGVPSIGPGGPPPPRFFKNLQTGPLSFLKICRRPPPVLIKIYFNRTLMTVRLAECKTSENVNKI